MSSIYISPINNILTQDACKVKSQYTQEELRQLIQHLHEKPNIYLSNLENYNSKELRIDIVTKILSEEDLYSQLTGEQLLDMAVNLKDKKDIIRLFLLDSKLFSKIPSKDINQIAEILDIKDPESTDWRSALKEVLHGPKGFDLFFKDLQKMRHEDAKDLITKILSEEDLYSQLTGEQLSRMKAIFKDKEDIINLFLEKNDFPSKPTQTVPETCNIKTDTSTIWDLLLTLHNLSAKYVRQIFAEKIRQCIVITHV